MSASQLSHHATVRMQQRGISETVVNLLLQYGSRRYDHRGAQIVYFDHRAIRRLSVAKGTEGLRDLEKLSDVYLVSSLDGELVTVGHRNKRLPN